MKIREKIRQLAATATLTAAFILLTGSAYAADEGQCPKHPSLIPASLLAENIGSGKLAIIDLRKTPEYNKGHIPGSLSLNVESLRGNIAGTGPLLLPSAMLAAHYSLMGIEPGDSIVFVYGDKLHDATLAAMSSRRLGHKNVAILEGGFGKWAELAKPTVQSMPVVKITDYPARDSDDFTVDYNEVFSSLDNDQIVIIDVRPSEYYTGSKSDEARAGHIPGALNRPITEDIDTSAGYPVFKSRDELAAAYENIIPSKDTTVIVHCRTGHQASQTFFVLKHILDYQNVLWYDGSWSQWAAIEQLPIE
jgi:thiosulfate/3-mercaptopyruvate sulfurtransferase